jgi:hypothetical protein
MTDTPQRLLDDMQALREAWTGDASPDLEAEFGDRARALGAPALLRYLFRTYQDAWLSGWLRSLRWLWEDVPYATWLELLEDLAEERRFVYQFLWFASESLALDIHRLPVFAQNVRIELDGETFRAGGPLPRSEDPGYEAMWQRLEHEGAPMRHVPPGAPDRHFLEL